jgi:hypothetical protein
LKVKYMPNASTRAKLGTPQTASFNDERILTDLQIQEILTIKNQCVIFKYIFINRKGRSESFGRNLFQESIQGIRHPTGR